MLLDYLKYIIKPKEIKRVRNNKLNVESGISITKSDLAKKGVTRNQAKKRKYLLEVIH